MNRTAMAWCAVAFGTTLLMACDSPVIPGRSAADVYDFALPSTPPMVLRWPTGTIVRVHVGTGAGAANDLLLSGAFAEGARSWNELAWFGEFRLTRASRPEAAGVVLSWSDFISDIVDTSSCRPTFARAVTTFCVVGFGTDTAHLQSYPLASTGTPSAIKMIVTLLTTEAVNPERVRLLVAHELGHVLGIGQHSPNPLDLMFRTDATATRPSVRDRATVQAMYRVRPDIIP